MPAKGAINNFRSAATCERDSLCREVEVTVAYSRGLLSVAYTLASVENFEFSSASKRLSLPVLFRVLSFNEGKFSRGIVTALSIDSRFQYYVIS